MKRIIFLLFAISFYTFADGQTASVSSGCTPLTVSFSAPDNSEGYYWIFKDGSTSINQNPEHIFTIPGEYLVELYNASGSQIIGNLTIKVFEDPIVTLTANVLSGCTPLEVHFTSIIESLDPGLEVTGYLWSFGDGNRSLEQNPTHTYTNPGLMSVSVELQTNLIDCKSTELIVQYINVEGPDATFEAGPKYICEAPLTVSVDPEEAFDPLNTYSWDFGNGETSSSYLPEDVVYTNPGLYVINHQVSSPEPCVSNFRDTILIGKPPLDFDPPDTVCLGQDFTFFNEIYAVDFEWDMPPDIVYLDESNEISRFPEVLFTMAGDRTISLQVYTLEDCKNDTTFTIHVEDPIADFSYMPPVSCDDPVEIIITADDDSYANYYYNGIERGSEYSFIYTAPERDSLFLNWVTKREIILLVETNYGCRDSIRKVIPIQRLPDAAFIPDTIRGCAPLQVDFEDVSGSVEDIIRWTYLFGDGETETYFDENDHQHVFENPGEFCVKLIIENSNGCIDTSACTWITVIDPPIFDLTIPDLGYLCSSDDIDEIFPPYNGPDPCYDPYAYLRDIQKNPGFYELLFAVSIEECMVPDAEVVPLEIRGPIAKISYMVDCDNPHQVMFENSSLDAGEILWDFDGLGTSSEESIVFTFPETGDYTVTLIALDTGNGCPPDTTTKVVHIREIEANFELPERICDGEFVTLNAEDSKDVHADCHKGYLWMFSESTPIMTDENFAQRALNSGQQEITLIVTDINGCKDTTMQSISIQNLMANYDNSLDRFCNGGLVDFTDLSQSDTTLVDWLWTFGEYGEFGTTTGPNPSYVFDNLVPPNVLVTMQVTDAAGCVDDVIKFVPVYEFTSSILEAPEGLCVGEEGFLLSQDFTGEGSFLEFVWDMGNGEFVEGINPTYIYDTTGVFEVILTYTEDQSGCFGMDTVTIVVEDAVESSFTSDVDGISPLCYPTIIEFFNGSDSTDNIEYIWDFGEGSNSILSDPTFAFGKGTFEVTLTTKVFGCENSSTQVFELVGPEGEIVIDDPRICLGEEIELSISDTVDVSSWIWDLGDGSEIVENENPFVYTYDNIPDNGKIYVDLILSSNDTGCEVIVTDTVFIAELRAEFEGIAAGYCEGLAEFTNTSVGASSYSWDFGDGETSTEFSPFHFYNNVGNYTVSLTATDSMQICMDVFTQEINLGTIADLGLFPNVFSPNNDGRNDFFNVAIREEFSEFVQVVTFKVFDRWGELLYNNESPSTGWDGNFDTKRVPAEVYAYYIEIEIQNCSTVAMKGNVTLIR